MILQQDEAELIHKASEVGIDWVASMSKLAPLNFPMIYKNPTMLDRRYQGKSALLTSVKWNNRIEYPFITFKTFKHGGVDIIYSGYKTAMQLQRQVKANITSKQTEEVFKAMEFNLSKWKDMTFVLETPDYFLQKKLPNAENFVCMKRGQDKGGCYTAIALWSLIPSKHVGFERIYDYQSLRSQRSRSEGGSSHAKMSSKGCGALGTKVAVVVTEQPKSPVVWVCEGVADAITIHLATKTPVYAAISAANIPKVVAYHVKLGRNVYVALDNDSEASDLKIKRKLCEQFTDHPVYVTSPKEHKDFNDVLVASNLETVIAELKLVQRICSYDFLLSK